jgi:hypothetical protein
MSNTVLSMVSFWELVANKDVRRETIGQYIGIKDKKNKQIFTQDLMLKDGDERIYEVDINYDGARPIHIDQLSSRPSIPHPSIDFLPLNVSGKHPLDQHTHGELIATDWIIVGTRFENPELLKMEN